MLVISCEKYQSTSNITGNSILKVSPIFKFKIVPHKPRLDCLDGWGLCNGHLWIAGHQIFKSGESISSSLLNIEGYIKESANLSERRFIFWYVDEDDVVTDTMEIEDDFNFAEHVCDTLGYSSITVKQGNYIYDNSIYDLGGYTLDITYSK